jgi:hypothetical protein
MPQALHDLGSPQSLDDVESSVSPVCGSRALIDAMRRFEWMRSVSAVCVSTTQYRRGFRAKWSSLGT